MKLSIYRSRLEKIIAERNGYLVLALGSLGLSLFLIFVIFCLIGEEKIIVVPPTLEKSFWVSKHNVSEEYLKEMTYFFAYLRFNITPSTAAEQREMLLHYTDPSYYETLKAQLLSEADHISAQHIAMAFFPTSYKVDIKPFAVVISGDLKTNIGDLEMPAQRINYRLTYRYDTGRLSVKSFEEVKHV